MKGEGGQVPPRDVAAGELDDSREKHEAEEQPPYQIARKPGRIVGAPGAPQLPRHREDGNERAFQQEEAPLEIKKGLPGGHERQVAGPEERQANGRGEAPKKEKCEADPEPAQDIDEAAGSENPAERGGLEPGSGAEMLVCRRKESARRQEPRRAQRPWRLGPDRPEGNGVRDCENAHKEA